MEQVSSFFGMGGYGAFVWSSYAITALVMIGLAVSSLCSLRERQRLLQQLETARPARPRRGAPSREAP